MSTAIERAVIDFSRLIPVDSLVLDVGCGRRPYEACFQGRRYVGLDVLKSGRTSSEKRPDVAFDGTRLPIASAAADAAICTEVLEHAVAPDLLLLEIFRVLKPGKPVLITVPFMWGIHEAPYDFRRFTEFGLARLLALAGFEIQRAERLVQGIEAIRMLVDSEVNNFRVNVLPGRHLSLSERGWLRLAFYLHDKLFPRLLAIWKRSLTFERVYIDNLVIAHKPSSSR